jgi:hypothetical protein
MQQQVNVGQRPMLDTKTTIDAAKFITGFMVFMAVFGFSLYFGLQP